MTSKTEQQIITKHILPNISRSKENETMKFGQLIEHNMRNISLEKLYARGGGEASPRPFHKKSKLNISPYQQSEMLYILIVITISSSKYIFGKQRDEKHYSQLYIQTYFPKSIFVVHFTCPSRG